MPTPGRGAARITPIHIFLGIILAFFVFSIVVWIFDAITAKADPQSTPTFWVDKYVDPYNPGTHCCSYGDCRPIATSQVATTIRRTANGWLYVPANELYPFAQTHVSEDGRWWVCLKSEPYVAPLAKGVPHLIRCLFNPPGQG